MCDYSGFKLDTYTWRMTSRQRFADRTTGSLAEVRNPPEPWILLTLYMYLSTQVNRNFQHPRYTRHSYIN